MPFQSSGDMAVLGAEDLVDLLVEPLGDLAGALDEFRVELARGLLELRLDELDVRTRLFPVQHARADLDRVDDDRAPGRPRTPHGRARGRSSSGRRSTRPSTRTRFARTVIARVAERGGGFHDEGRRTCPGVLTEPLLRRYGAATAGTAAAPAPRASSSRRSSSCLHGRSAAGAAAAVRPAALDRLRRRARDGARHRGVAGGPLLSTGRRRAPRAAPRERSCAQGSAATGGRSSPPLRVPVTIAAPIQPPARAAVKSGLRSAAVPPAPPRRRRDGPRRRCPAPSGRTQTSASTSSEAPSNTASTEPSFVLRTQPVTPRRCASSRVESREEDPLHPPMRS